MSTQLINNIPNMNNPELIGLAKNRFLPASVQMAIAKASYRRAHMYLCENTGLAKDVRDYLYSDQCNRGYVNKSTLICHGHYNDEPEKIAQFYESHGTQMYSRSPWRANHCFLRANWYTNTQSNTPPEVLNKIYNNHIAKPARHGNDYWQYNYALKDLAQHQNCDLPLAIKLSTCGNSDVEKLAFAKIVQLSK